MKAKSKSAAPARRQNTRGDATRDRILDAAEKLFALNSYEGVSMRDVAAEAQTELGTLVHHFRTKDGLFTAVLDRRTDGYAGVLKERLQELLKEKGESATIEDILGVYAARLFAVARGEHADGRHFLQIVTQRVPLRSGHLHPSLAATYMPVRKLYLKELKKRCPGLPRMQLDNFFSLFELSFGTALFSPMQERFAIEQRGTAKLKQLEANYIRLFAAGLAAIADGS